ncbi:MAG: aminoglycoside phosphotransferase family protein [Nitrososphaerota archaeon]
MIGGTPQEIGEIRMILKQLTGGEEPDLRPLGGGVSCLVFLASTSRGMWVVKKALPKLMVRDEWVADRGRIFRETGCLRVIRELVDRDAAPEVILEDRIRYACVLEYGDGGVTWKELLMRGVIDPSVTVRVASILVRLHQKTRGVERLAAEFGDDTNFVQLRIDPYITHVAGKHLDIAAKLTHVAELLRRCKVCLVHGDYSPKNILLLPDGRIWILDCEPAHFGNPVFDIAFCTNHLILKSIHLRSAAHLEEGQRLWRIYWNEAGWDNAMEWEEEAVKVLATLLLARVDGKSPVEYLSEDNRGMVRRLSKKLIADSVDDFGELIIRVKEVIS